MIPNNLPAELAEKLNDPPVDERLVEQKREEALTRLVDEIMAIREYPAKAHSSQQINLLDILADCDQWDLAVMVLTNIDSLDMRDGIEKLVKDYLRDTHWHDMMVDDIELDRKYNQGENDER